MKYSVFVVLIAVMVVGAVACEPEEGPGTAPTVSTATAPPETATKAPATRTASPQPAPTSTPRDAENGSAFGASMRRSSSPAGSAPGTRSEGCSEVRSDRTERIRPNRCPVLKRRTHREAIRVDAQRTVPEQTSRAPDSTSFRGAIVADGGEVVAVPHRRQHPHHLRSQHRGDPVEHRDALSSFVRRPPSCSSKAQEGRPRTGALRGAPARWTPSSLPLGATRHPATPV